MLTSNPSALRGAKCNISDADVHFFFISYKCHCIYIVKNCEEESCHEVKFQQNQSCSIPAVAMVSDRDQNSRRCPNLLAYRSCKMDEHNCARGLVSTEVGRRALNHHRTRACHWQARSRRTDSEVHRRPPSDTYAQLQQ